MEQTTTTNKQSLERRIKKILVTSYTKSGVRAWTLMTAHKVGNHYVVNYGEYCKFLSAHNEKKK